MGIAGLFSDLMAGVGFHEAHAEAPAEEEENKEDGADVGEEKSEEGGEERAGGDGGGEEESGAEEEAEAEEEDDEPVDPKPKLEEGQSTRRLLPSQRYTPDSKLTAGVLDRMRKISSVRALQASFRRMCGEGYRHGRGSRIQGTK
jgi:cobalamin biosynthesis protein CobT